jgi:hypothetical protein
MIGGGDNSLTVNDTVSNDPEITQGVHLDFILINTSYLRDLWPYFFVQIDKDKHDD